MESKDIELEVSPEDQHGSLQDPPPEKARQEGEEEGEDEFDFGPAVYDENLYGGLGLDILSFLINFMKIDICMQLWLWLRFNNFFLHKGELSFIFD